jgi:hypothetical protein
MNPFDALIERKTPEQRREWMEPVKRNGTAHIAPEPRATRPALQTKHYSQDRPGVTRPIPYSAMCVCGRRYGAHRVNDYACPNQRWIPGNGQPQWLEQAFARA